MDTSTDLLLGKRVLLVVENLSVPADRRVWQEACALRDAGMVVTVICPLGTDRDSTELDEREGITIHRFRTREGNGVVGFAMEHLTAALRIRRLATSLSAAERFDIVHVANPPDLLLPALRQLRRTGARFIFDHHDLAPELYRSRFGRSRDPIYWTLRVLERATFGLADVVISTNGSYRDLAIKRGGVDASNVFVVRNGPDTERFTRRASDASLRRGKAYLLAYLGVMAPQDGVDVALRALSILQRTRSDWHAVFMGDGPARPAMMALARDLGIADSVEFPGWVDEDAFLPVLSNADICLSPEPPSPLNSHSTLIKVAEYMALGAPVVAFDLAETRATAGDAAVYADGDGPGDFAKAIDALLSDSALRRRKSELASRRVTEQLAWEHSARMLLRAYAYALGDNDSVSEPSIGQLGAVHR